MYTQARVTASACFALRQRKYGCSGDFACSCGVCDAALLRGVQSLTISYPFVQNLTCSVLLLHLQDCCRALVLLQLSSCYNKAATVAATAFELLQQTSDIRLRRYKKSAIAACRAAVAATAFGLLRLQPETTIHTVLMQANQVFSCYACRVYI